MKNYLKINSINNIDIFQGLDLIEDNSIDLIIADPPYNISISSWDTFKSKGDYFNFMHEWLFKSIKKLKTTGSLYLFNNEYNSAILIDFIEKSGMNFQNWITWYKKDGFSPSKKRYVNAQEIITFFTRTNKYSFNYEEIREPYTSTKRMEHAMLKGIIKNNKRWFPNPNGKMRTNVWEISSERHNKMINGKKVKMPHPTMKPEKLIDIIIKASSNKGDIVLDLFSGSGTTSVIAKRLNRNFIAIENNDEYINIIKDRLNE